MTQRGTQNSNSLPALMYRTLFCPCVCQSILALNWARRSADLPGAETRKTKLRMEDHAQTTYCSKGWQKRFLILELKHFCMCYKMHKIMGLNTFFGRIQPLFARPAIVYTVNQHCSALTTTRVLVTVNAAKTFENTQLYAYFGVMI